MTERMKASDVFRERDLFLGRKTTFEEAFPTVKDVTVKVLEDGDGVREWGKPRYYGSNSAGEYINCSNPLCYNGGFSLGGALRRMVSEGQTEKEKTFFCQGYEGSPKGRRKYRDCANSFEVSIRVTYKKPPAQEAEDA